MVLAIQIHGQSKSLFFVSQDQATSSVFMPRGIVRFLEGSLKDQKVPVESTGTHPSFI